MNWFSKAFALFTLWLWLFPPTVGVGIAALAYHHVPYWSYALALLPTIILALAIGQSIATKSRSLPRWAWWFDTPDSPTSPYSDFEPTAAQYYLTWLPGGLRRLLGDYLWFAWRNQWYGLGFKWGVNIDPAVYKYLSEGNPRVGDTANYDGTGAFVYGTYRMSVYDSTAQEVAWEYKQITKLGPIMLKFWFGWKDLNDYFHYTKEEQEARNITNPAMMAFQFYLRKAK